MSLDPALESALKKAVENAGQDAPVAHRLIAWLRALSDGESSEEQDLSFYANVMGVIAVGEAPDED